MAEKLFMIAFKRDRLNVKVVASRLELGQAAAAIVAEKILKLMIEKDFVNIIFAAAPSQNEFISFLLEQQEIDWNRVNAFHMDEYIGLQINAPQRFGNFLKECLFDQVQFRSVYYIDGHAVDEEEECKRYSKILTENPPDIVCMGIGENGHIAFNDPHVADFNDPKSVKVVDLDLACRQQQVNDGCFSSISDVPIHAITLTIPTLMSARSIYCMVPGKRKANAVAAMLNGEINERCPASVLRTHPDAILFLDRDSFLQ